ncbi:MAG: PepSY domain-containing protein, partial [Acetobacteraceae bacterium]
VIATMIATGAAGGGVAYAAGHNQEAQDAQALANSKISLSQAITTAEQKTGGKAFDAGVDNNNGTARISVEVASNQGVKTVLVDPQTGQVIGINVGGDQHGQEND